MDSVDLASCGYLWQCLVATARLCSGLVGQDLGDLAPAAPAGGPGAAGSGDLAHAASARADAPANLLLGDGVAMANDHHLKAWGF